MSSTRSEDQLLLWAARQSIKPGDRRELRELLSQEMNWESLLDKAHHHALVPLLTRQITAVDSGTLPESVRAEIHNYEVQHTRLTLLLTGELLKVAEALAAESIPVMSFKGPTLALLAYGDPGLRQFADVDVLVREKDFACATSLLTALDFKSAQVLTAGQLAGWLRFECAQNFESTNGAVLDLHWRLFEPHWAFDFDAEQLWGRLTPVPVGGKEVLTLSMEDLLVAICVHGFTHSWERLGWICDVAGLITRQRLNWQMVMQRSAEWRVRRILLLGLILAHELMDAPVPVDLLKLARQEGEVTRCAHAVHQNLFAEQPASGHTANLGLQTGMRERWGDRIGSLLSFAITPRHYDLMYASVPAQLPELYYLVRPLRMAAQYTSKLFKQISTR